METIENRTKKRLRRGQVESVIFGTLIVMGAMMTSGSPHNMVKVLKQVDSSWFKKRDPRQRIRETVSKLKRKGLIEFVSIKGKQRMRLTQSGSRLAKKIHTGNVEISKPRKWDGQWRIIIFDIPERKRSLRDRVRSLVRSLGFYRLQDSVWVHPYECEEIIMLLKADLGVGKDVLYIIGAAIEFDRPLRQHFNLPMS